MAIPPRQIDQAANRRSGLRVIGVILVLLSIAAVAYGIGQLNDVVATPDGFNDQMVSATTHGSNFTGMFLIAAGAIGLLIGFGCLTSSFTPAEPADTRPASGRTCPACGLLNEGAATTCEACGEPLAS